MIPFKVFNEKRVSNPLRKGELAGEGNLNYNDPNFANELRDIVKYSNAEDITGVELLEIKRQYDKLKISLPPRAEAYLNSAIAKLVNDLKRPTAKGYKKVYENGGIQVFVDEENLPDGDFSPGSYNFRMVKNGVDNMLQYTRDLFPNKKTKFVITDLQHNPYVAKDYNKGNAALYFDKHIFLDWKSIDDNNYYVHEYAHHVADTIPSQTKNLLIQSYKEMLDLYFRKVKKRKVAPEEIDDNIRMKIAQKLGFPVYGLTNPDELFAVIIEFWKKFPNNPMTYKFKSLVKKVLTRL